MGFFARLWRGNVSLFTSFWIFGGLIMFMFKMLEQATLNISEQAYFTGMTISLLYYAFISVAIWRSSLNYRGTQLYAILAQGSIVIGWLRYAWILFMPEMGPLIEG